MNFDGFLNLYDKESIDRIKDDPHFKVCEFINALTGKTTTMYYCVKRKRALGSLHLPPCPLAP